MMLVQITFESLKSNHPTLFQQVEQWFQQAHSGSTLPTPREHTTETGHHRIETRTVWTLSVSASATLHQQGEWAGLQSVVIVERTRRLWNKTTHEVQFYLSSLPPESPQIATAIRQHWGIENGLHWILDVTFGEDACRVRSLHAPHNLSLLRRFAINTLNRVAGKQSLRQKSKRAAMDDGFMLRVLAAALPDPSENANPSCQ